MSEYGLIDKAILDGIGNAVREKTGGTEEIPVNAVAEEIRGLNVAREPYIEEEYNNQSKLVKAHFHGGIGFLRDNIFADCSELTEVTGLPENLDTIGVNSFYMCTKLETCELPNTVTKIDDYAFEKCGNIRFTELPSSLRYIGEKAFRDCKEMALTELPQSLVYIGDSAFSDCPLVAISVIPDNVTYIGGLAFYGFNNGNFSTSITSITFPRSLETIGSRAFCGQRGLTTVTFKGTPTSISGLNYSAAFEECTNLTTINVPWSEGEVAGAPWGATNATINYNYVPPTENDGESGEEE